MADAPKDGGIGFMEGTIGLFVVLALLSGVLKTNTTADVSTTGQQASTSELTTPLTTDGSCSLVLQTPIAFQFVGEKYMKIQGALKNCTTSDKDTAFFLQIFDANNVPVSEYLAIPSIEKTESAITFNTTIAFTSVSRTKRGTAVFTPNVAGVTTAQAVRVPVVFRK